MANYVKISTIGATALGGNHGTGDEAVKAMIKYWEQQFAQVLPDQPDLISVPECCDRYPALSGEDRLAYYQYRGHKIGDYFASVARDNHCYVAYPALRLMDDGTWRNSVELFDRSGQSMGFYNKNYPVITENTDGGVLAGRDAPLFECDFGSVGCAICFDLNFDGIRMKYAKSHPDIIVFASMYHGGLMQRYWAYSCRSHLVTSIHGSPSGIISPVGDLLATSTNYFNFVTHTVNLDCRVVHLDFNWQKLTAMKKKYGVDVSIYDPGYLGSVLISSESDEVTIDELIAEFELELLDDYIKRSAEHAENPANMEPA